VVLVFLVQTIVAFFQRSTESFGFWNWVAAGETAAWRLKWISIPLLFATLFFGRKLYQSIRLQPERFCGVRYARRGLIATASVVLLIAFLIGVTVPERLRQRQMSKDAAILAQYYTIERALFEYRIKHKTLPADFKELQDGVSDPDGTLAQALAGLDSTFYRPTGEVAANATEKSPRLRGAAIRKASFSSATDDATPSPLSFTTYELRLPGEDKIMGNEDDWIARDGMIMKLSSVAKGEVGRFVSAGALQP
jgi:hypothetical protein